MQQKPYIEPTIRTIAGFLILVSGALAFWLPGEKLIWLSLLIFVGFNLFQSGLSKFCLMEKILKYAGFRSEMDEIRTMTLHDLLTGLPNRRLLEDRAITAIALAERNHGKVALLFLDMDNFKNINDSRGHKVGDQILISISEILKQKLRKTDTLARWGGDEFVVLLPGITNEAEVRHIADKLMSALKEDMIMPQGESYITMSVGGAFYPDDADTYETLILQADKALGFVKSQGRNNLCLFSQINKLDADFLQHDYSSKLKEALKNKEIDVHFQPIVCSTTHKPIAIEALARWHNPELGWISPGIFIPVAEDHGMMIEMGKQVYEKAFQYFSHCPMKDQIKLALNVSGRQIFHKNFIKDLVYDILKYNLSPKNIKLEITESLALQVNETEEILKKLSRLGFTLSLDDFGTGYSSLSRLHEMTTDEMKIDISFVKRIKTQAGKAMLRSIVGMGKSMRLNLVAEGVEDLESASILRDLGVDNLQGYYFSKPMDNQHLQDYLANLDLSDFDQRLQA